MESKKKKKIAQLDVPCNDQVLRDYSQYLCWCINARKWLTTMELTSESELLMGIRMGMFHLTAPRISRHHLMALGIGMSHLMILGMSRSGLIISFCLLPSSSTYSPYIITLLFHHIPSSYPLYITHY